jgi:hypothetical protein
MGGVMSNYKDYHLSLAKKKRVFLRIYDELTPKDGIFLVLWIARLFLPKNDMKDRTRKIIKSLMIYDKAP